MTTRVLLVDDHEDLRDELRSVLEVDGSFEVVGEASNGLEASRLVEKTAPNVIVMDVAMPVMNGIDAAREILTKGFDVKILALSMHADSRYVREMLEAGAHGYLLKDSAAEGLCAAIEAIVMGATYLGPGVEPPTIMPSLTSRDV